MPRSILLGRPWPQAGEPLFTQEDTAWVLALAEEERDTCHSCGYPKVWCRDPEHQFAFDAEESICWPTYRLALHRQGEGFKGYDDATRSAAQMSARFRSGHDPDLTAGLDLPADEDDQP